MNGHKTSKSGSALLLTLLVVSLLLVIVLSFTVYVRLELRSISNQQDLILARQNAKLAMNLALAQLQKAAGPDQRVTARAEILGGTLPDGNRFWTGVWDRNPSGGVDPNPKWMISGTGSSPLNAVGLNSIELFPSINGDPAVSAPLEHVPDLNGDIRGKIAYWVSEEAVKAPINARRSGITIYEDPSFSIDRSLVEFQADFGVNLENLFNNPFISLTDRVLPSLLERVTIPEELLFVEDSNGVLFTPKTTPQGSILPLHDITFQSFGVLENAYSGGLKINLSDLNPTDSNITGATSDSYDLTGNGPDSLYDDGFLNTPETRKFLDPEKNRTLKIEYRDPTTEGIVQGDPFFSPRPLLTEAAIYIGLFHARSTAKISSRFHVESEIINPYSLPLALDTGSFGQLTLAFDNLPTITVRDESGVGPTITKDMDDAENNTNPNSKSYFCTVYVKPDGNPILNPGEIYRSYAPNQNQGLARDIDLINKWAAGDSTRPGDQAWIEVTADHGNDPLIVKLVHPDFDYNNQNVGVAHSITMSRDTLPFTDFTFRKRFYSGPSPFSRSSSGSYTINDYNLAYHYRLWSEVTDPTSIRDLISSIPILDPDILMSGTYTDIGGNDQSYTQVMSPVSMDPSLVVQSINPFDEQDLFSDPTRDSRDSLGRVFNIVDVPLGDSLSVGILSSLPIYREPPRIIGSPWGGDYNEAFDRYYFSPKRSHPDTGEPMRIHPGIMPALLHEGSSTVLQDVANINDAKEEMVLGPFNLNSTSVDAWKAILSAPIQTPKAADETGSGDRTRSATFVSMPHLQSEVGEDYVVTDAEVQNPENAFARGIRSLDDSNLDNRISEMAQSIVDDLKAKGEPFADLESLINSGILQDAIDNINSGGPVNDGIVEYSNLFLTQNALLTKLAPFASTRSDTFTIRAYGNVLDPKSGKIISEATCEAVVQRIPLKLDGSDAMTPSQSLLDSRKFLILSFRWLHHEDS